MASFVFRVHPDHSLPSHVTGPAIASDQIDQPFPLLTGSVSDRYLFSNGNSSLKFCAIVWDHLASQSGDHRFGRPFISYSPGLGATARQ
jgi:hypothetical protein